MRGGALSPREREVLGHVVQGGLNKQIAADLTRLAGLAVVAATAASTFP